MDLSENNAASIATSVVLGVALYVCIKQTERLSKKAYRRLRPAK